LVGKDHPDVEALALAINDQTSPIKAMSSPPMLRASWDIWVKESAQRPHLVPYNLWREVALVADLQPFLVWRGGAKAADIEDALAPALDRHERLARAARVSRREDPGPVSTLDADPRRPRLASRAQGLDTDELMSSLGVPASAMDFVLGGKR
jgi:hypothetical protein